MARFGSKGVVFTGCAARPLFARKLPWKRIFRMASKGPTADIRVVASLCRLQLRQHVIFELLSGDSRGDPGQHLDGRSGHRADEHRSIPHRSFTVFLRRAELAQLGLDESQEFAVTRTLCRPRFHH
jgi:hypothetical protein